MGNNTYNILSGSYAIHLHMEGGGGGGGPRIPLDSLLQSTYSQFNYLSNAWCWVTYTPSVHSIITCFYQSTVRWLLNYNAHPSALTPTSFYS